MTDQVSADLRVGSELAGYRIERLLGRGGMSVVYLAEDTRLERKVALKLLAPELSEDERFRERFLRESKLAASLDHPNVIPIFEAGEAGGVLFIAMRFVEGSDLKRVLAEEGRLEPARAVGVLERVADALDAAHRRGLVHRDVKPGNVLISADGHVYLSDFGLTKQAGSESGVTETGQFVGTADYVAPEQIERRDVSAVTDEYSLACVLYECLTGGPPFRGESLMGTLFGHVNDEARLVSDVNPELPGEIDAVLVRGMAKEPGERYPSCGSLVEDARSALSLSGELAASPVQRRRRGVVLAVAALIVILVVATVLAVVLTGDGDGAVVGGAWSRVPHNEAAFGGTLGSEAIGIAAGEQRLVAVGSEGRSPDQTGETDAAAWTSPDGVVWSKVSDPDLGGPLSQTANSVSAGPGGFVAVGTEFDLEAFTFGTALWRSPDGSDWERVKGSEEVFGGPSGGVMWEVAAGGPGYVVIGWTIGPMGAGVVWTSPDGVSWSRVPSDPAVFGPRILREGFGNQIFMNGVAIGDDGRVAAVGSDWLFSLDEQGSGQAEVVTGAAWVSTNGVSWIRASHDDAVFGDGSTTPSLDDVEAGGPGFVAVGVETPLGEVEGFIQDTVRDPGASELRAVVVTSEDGLAWSRVPNEQLPGTGENIALNAITSGGPGLVAVGYRREQPGVLDANIDLVVWTSSDGLTWTEAADPEGVLSQPGGQVMAGVTAGGPGLVAIGQDGSSTSSRTAVWTSP